MSPMTAPYRADTLAPDATAGDGLRDDLDRYIAEAPPELRTAVAFVELREALARQLWEQEDRPEEWWRVDRPLHEGPRRPGRRRLRLAAGRRASADVVLEVNQLREQRGDKALRDRVESLLIELDKVTTERNRLRLALERVRDALEES